VFALAASNAFAQGASQSCVSTEQVQAMMADLKVALRKELLAELRGETAHASASANVAETGKATGTWGAETSNSEATTPPPANALAIEYETSPAATQDAIRISTVGAVDDAGSDGRSTFQISANTDGTRASLKNDYSYSDPVNGTYTARSVVVSAPLDKKSQNGTNLATLDGLTSGFEISFNYDHFSKGPKRPRNPIGELRTDCEALGIEIDAKKESCNLYAVLDAALPRKTEAQKAVYAKHEPKHHSLLTGFQFKVGHDDFNYLGGATLSKQKVNRVPWSVGGRVGTLGAGWYFGGGLTFQQTYTAAPSQTACLIEAGDTVAECVTGSLAPPKNTKKYLAVVEGRGAIRDVGVGIKLLRDFNNDEWGAEVPIFLFRSEKNVLNGGVRFSWTTTEKFVAGIFVGVPFNYSP